MLSKVKLGSKAAGVLAGQTTIYQAEQVWGIGSASQSMQKEYNFYQNNYSPKRCPDLTFIDKAKNLLSQAREGVNVSTYLRKRTRKNQIVLHPSTQYVVTNIQGLTLQQLP